MTETRNEPIAVAAGYSQIVVPVDFSSLGWRVYPLAQQLAQLFDAPLRLLHVDSSSPWSDAPPQTLRLRATPFRHPVQVDVVPDRDIALGIARAIVADDVLVVMGSHAHTGAGEIVGGGSTDAILRALDTPVVLGGPEFRDARAPIQRIVCCLDLDQPPVDLLADVAHWARVLDVGIELLTVLPVGRALEELAEHERRLVVMTDRLNSDGLHASAVVLRSNRPGHEIVEFVNETPGTLTALTTHARTAAVRVLVGSVGMKVVRNAYGPVLLRRRDR